MSITKSELQHWREVCEAVETARADGYSLFSGERAQALGEFRRTMDAAKTLALLDRISTLEREKEDAEKEVYRWKYGAEIARSSGERAVTEAAELRTRISTLERLCREACEIGLSWSGDDTEDGLRISAILAAVEGES